MSCDNCTCNEQKKEQEVDQNQSIEEKLRAFVEQLTQELNPEKEERQKLVEELRELEEETSPLLLPLLEKLNNTTDAQFSNIAEIIASTQHLSEVVVQTQVLLSTLITLLNNKEVINLNEFAETLTTNLPKRE